MWTTCLLFFQTALFAGYAYSHFSERCLPNSWRLALHLGLILTASSVLPIAPKGSSEPEEAQGGRQDHTRDVGQSETVSNRPAEGGPAGTSFTFSSIVLKMCRSSLR